MKRTDAVLFEATLSSLWAPEEPAPRIIHALVSFVKNHRINPENAFEVLQILWPDATMKFLALSGDEQPSSDDPSEVWFEVTFADGSRADVQALRGIGAAVERIR